MKKSLIYTKTGDKGETSLVGGTRISKADARIDLYGEVDELNARVGVVTAHIADQKKFEHDRLVLAKIQNKLFDIGSNLACVEADRKKWKLPHLEADDVKMLESEIDRMDEKLPKLTNFILPGGSQAGALLHLCRTGCRLVERRLIAWEIESGESAPDHCHEFFNRLSDYFFVLSRWFNMELGQSETAWKKSN